MYVCTGIFKNSLYSHSNDVDRAVKYFLLPLLFCRIKLLHNLIELLTEKTRGQGCVIFVEEKNKEQNAETPLRRGNILTE